MFRIPILSQIKTQLVLWKIQARARPSGEALGHVMHVQNSSSCEQAAQCSVGTYPLLVLQNLLRLVLIQLLGAVKCESMEVQQRQIKVSIHAGTEKVTVRLITTICINSAALIGHAKVSDG